MTVGYGEQTVRETKRNTDAFETPTLLDDEVCQRGMTVTGHEDICKPERPLKVTENGTIQKFGHDFLITLHSNYGRIFSRFDRIHERDRETDTDRHRTVA